MRRKRKAKKQKRIGIVDLKDLVDLDDDDLNWCFSALIETRWCDTGQLLTEEETLHAIETREFDRPVELSLRVPQGTDKRVFSAGTSIFEVDGFEQWFLIPTVGRRLWRRKKKISDEHFRLMLGVIAGVKPSRLRAAARNKRKDSEAFRRLLARLKAQSQKLLFRSDEARLHRFLSQNWNKWGTVKNPRAREKPALHAWHPRAALALIGQESGCYIHPKAHNPVWYKRVRRLLRLKPALPYSVNEWPEKANHP